jgi:hypothetical protein
MRLVVITIALALAFMVAPVSAGAADFDGSQPLLCAIIKIVECSPQGDCQQVSPAEAGIPRFIEIDFKKMEISEVGEFQDERRTPFKTLEKGENTLTLQGGQNNRAWSTVISRDTGEAVITVSDVYSGFVIFGACTPR